MVKTSTIITYVNTIRTAVMLFCIEKCLCTIYYGNSSQINHNSNNTHNRGIVWKEQWTLEGQTHGQNPVFFPGLAVSSMLL